MNTRHMHGPHNLSIPPSPRRPSDAELLVDFRLVLSDELVEPPHQLPRPLADRRVVVGALVPAPRQALQKTIRPSTTIDAPTRKPKLAGGDPKNKENTGGGKGKHELLLFDDPVNTREYVSRVLCTKVALSEGEAYDCMMTAHQAGMAIVGVYQFEVAENYCTQMKESGLVAAVKPVGDGNE